MNTSEQIAEQLKDIPAGFLQQDLFNQIARLGVLSYIELLVYRMNDGQVEVLLTRRAPDDKFWPNMYHNPGTVLRPNDSTMSFTSAINRLIKDEYANQAINNGPYFAGLWFDQLERGKGLGIIAWTELDSCPVGSFYPINQLPEAMIKGQANYIQKAARQYKDYKDGKLSPTPLEQLILQ